MRKLHYILFGNIALGIISISVAHADNADTIDLNVVQEDTEFLDVMPEQNMSGSSTFVLNPADTDASIDNLQHNLPSDSEQTKGNVATSRPTKAESIEYLKTHPQEFEKLLMLMLLQVNAASLSELLPVYETIPNYDPAVMDWGKAIILANSGNLKEAIKQYRLVNAKLPKVTQIRFQLATALFFNQQYQASKLEFEKLRSSLEKPADIEMVDNYLEAISKRDDWSFNANGSFLNDKNITNSPKKGTKLSLDNGSEVTYGSERQTGKGVRFNFSADKKWLNDNRLFASMRLGTYGNYYWNNDNYNDLTASISQGLGYQSKSTEIEVAPYYSKRWYAGGSSGNGQLKDYSDTHGVRLNVAQWINPKLRYGGYVGLSKSEYIGKYRGSDSDDKTIVNSLMYFYDQNQYYRLSGTYSEKESESEAGSYDRRAVNVAWGKTWGYGYSTSLNLGYAKRDYKAEDLWGLVRENDEYSAGITLWNRGFSVLGLTPKLTYDYLQVESNSSLEEYKKNDVSLVLSKTF